MDEHFHIIIASDKRKPISLRFSKVSVIVTMVTIFTIAIALFSTGFFTTGLYTQNRLMAKSTNSIKAKMHDAVAVRDDLEMQLEEEKQKNLKMVEAF